MFPCPVIVQAANPAVLLDQDAATMLHALRAVSLVRCATASVPLSADFVTIAHLVRQVPPVYALVASALISAIATIAASATGSAV